MIKKVIISGGGTGGHVFPALAIANEIKRRYPASVILFVGASDRMEMEKVPAAGYQIIGLPVTGFPRKPGFNTVRFIFRLLKSYRKAKKIINEFMPQLAIGVGGFASGPLLRAASAKGIPYLIQEQNSYAGITNKLLAKKAEAVCVAFEGMEKYFPDRKIVITGNPVREYNLNENGKKEEAVNYFGLKKGKEVILVTGGSLGARSLNNAMMNNLQIIASSDVEIIWQTGSFYYKEIQEDLKDRTPSNLIIVEFISRMDLAYSVAGVVICRAGAGTIAELCLAGKPAILVPSPNVAEDHQTRNAMSLVNKGAALMLKDNEIDEKLLPAAINLIKDKEQRSLLSDKIKKLAMPDAAGRIVDEAEKLLI